MHTAYLHPLSEYIKLGKLYVLFMSSFLYGKLYSIRMRMTTDHPTPKPWASLIQKVNVVLHFNSPMDPVCLDFMSVFLFLLHCYILACIPFLSCLHPWISFHPALLYLPWFFSMSVVPKSGIVAVVVVGYFILWRPQLFCGGDASIGPCKWLSSWARWMGC